MQLLDATLPDAASNLALDESLLLEAEAGRGGAVLRLWELPTYAVILGAAGSLAIDVHEPACSADGVPILRRSSGGGTVLIGPGCLLFSVVLAYDAAPRLNEILPSIRHVLGRVAKALQPIAGEIVLDGISDLTRDGRKFSGNSQQRKRKHFLHHGTLLCGFDIARIRRYLNAPERQPEYRRDRAHEEFIVNLPCTTSEVREVLVREWEATPGDGSIPWEIVNGLVAEKYGLDSWTRRR